MNQLPNAEIFFLTTKKKLTRKSTHKLFGGKDILAVGLPAAYSPTDTQMVKEYEAAYADICACGIDEIYFVSMNDPYVMDAWWKSMKIKKCKYLADGNGAFSFRVDQQGGMSGGLAVVEMYNRGLGKRSWRYACLIEDNCQMAYLEEETPDGNVERNNLDSDIYELTTVPETIKFLKNRNQADTIAKANEHAVDPAMPQ